MTNDKRFDGSFGSPKTAEQTNKPTKRFNFRAKLDLAPLREKDNAKPTLKPTFAKKPAPNLAPPGCAGIRRRPANDRPDFEF